MDQQLDSTPRRTTKDPKKVAIIGGGAAGLATAGLLAREGHQVTLLDKNPTLGGRARLLERDGFRFDAGPSWFLMRSVFENFFALMGTRLEDELDLVDLDGYTVNFEGDDAPMRVRPDLEAMAAAFERIEPGAGDQLRRYVASARETYAIAEQHLLYNNYNSLRSFTMPEVAVRLPRFASLLARTLDSFAADFFKDWRLRQIVEYPAVFLGSSPFDAPAMYHLMSHLDFEDGVLYPQGGFTELVEAMARCARGAGAELRTGVEARRIVVEDGKVTGVLTEDGFLEADLVVGATDLHHIETRLLDDEHRSRPESWWAGKDPGPSALLIYLGVKGELPHLDHHNLYFTRNWPGNFDAVFNDRTIPDPASFYVCRPSATDPSVAPEGHENLFVLVPWPADPDISAQEIEAHADSMLKEFGRWAGIEDLESRIVVREVFGPRDFASTYHAWNGSALGLGHGLMQSALFRPSQSASKVKGLYYSGSSTRPGVGIPMCLISAQNVLKLLRGDNSTGALDPETAWAD